jgi:hypothetical protein
MATNKEAAPEGIPQDFWDAACRTFKDICTPADGADDRIIIARALMASYVVGWNAGVKADRKR